MKTTFLVAFTLAAVLVGQGATAPPCPEMGCLMACQHGFKVDVNGCDICACRELPCRDVTCVLGKVCEVYVHEDEDPASGDARCADPNLPARCRHPMEKGTCSGSGMRWYYDTEYDQCEEFMYSGCHGNDNIFNSLIDCEMQCRPDLGVKPGCSPATCMMFCQHGFQVNEDGCEMCHCRQEPGFVADEQPRLFSMKTACMAEDEIVCNLNCLFGFKRNEFGCAVCECHVPAHCKAVQCSTLCQFGGRVDGQGCETCVCRVEGECAKLSCRMNCPFGPRLDAHGCPHCECRADPCQEKDCPVGTYCTLNEEIASPSATCLLEDSWDGQCPEVSCMMHCDHGFKSDPYGCSICECRASEQNCLARRCSRCHFGYATDEEGCTTCHCLENPCQDKACERQQLCEVKKACPAVGCRHKAFCTARDEIRQVHVDITVVHQPVTSLNEDGFLTELQKHMASLLGVEDCLIKGIKVRHRDNTSLDLEFHLLRADTEDLEEEINMFRHRLEVDIDQATLTYADMAFLPQPESLLAMYHSSDYHKMESAEASNITTIIIVGAVVGGLLLIALLAIVIAKIQSNKKKSTHRKNIIYRKAGDPSDGVVVEPLET